MNTSPTDRELLEAAYAAYRPGQNYIRLINDAGREYWNPINDDGDALRLAVNLRLTVNCSYDDVAICGQEFTQKEVFIERNGEDPLAATRRAIVRAAAAIGKEMK
jgi:hypothetical protein